MLYQTSKWGFSLCKGKLGIWSQCEYLPLASVESGVPEQDFYWKICFYCKIAALLNHPDMPEAARLWDLLWVLLLRHWFKKVIVQNTSNATNRVGFNEKQTWILWKKVCSCREGKVWYSWDFFQHASKHAHAPRQGIQLDFENKCLFEINCISHFLHYTVGTFFPTSRHSNKCLHFSVSQTSLNYYLYCNIINSLFFLSRNIS